jgi:hypothetical protein
MPTNLPTREPPLTMMLLDIARSFIAMAFLLVAIALLWARFSPWAHTMARIGKRISSVGGSR